MPKIILLPGLGADERLLRPQKVVFPDLIVPSWLKPVANETLSNYAIRLAKQCESLVQGEPFFLGGVSFGGMVALEMARVMNPKAVFLIASSRTGKSLKPLHDFFRVILPLVPRGVFSFIKERVAPLSLKRLGDMDAAQRRVCLDMMNDSNIDFFSWAARTLLSWTFTGDLSCPVYTIHGANDRIIPLKKVQPDEVIPGGGHVINLTHADEVNQFIRARLHE